MSASPDGLGGQRDALPDSAVATWQQRTARRLDLGDVREIRANLVGFFSLLAEWDRPAASESCTEVVRLSSTGTVETSVQGEKR